MRLRDIIVLTEARGRRVEINLSNSGGEVTGWIQSINEAELEETLGGMATPGLATSLVARYTRMAILDTIDTDEDLRGQGFGKDLFRQFLRAAKRGRAQAILLEAAVYAAPVEGFDLVRWYRLLGFEAIGKAGADGSTMMLLPLR